MDVRCSVLLVLVGCSKAGLPLRADGDPPPAGGPLTTAPPPGGEAPPEQEEDLLLLPPAQTEQFVFVANPERDTLTRVDVRTLDVRTTPVGGRPEVVLTTPDHATAVVLNLDDDTLDLVDAGTLERTTVEARPNLNTMALSPDGAWVVAWRDLAREDPAEPLPDGIQSFNEASFVSIADGRHYPMAVGFDPRMVRFTPDSRLAIIVSDGYLAKVDLTAALPVPELVELAPGDLDAPPAEEVVLSTDGSFAWVRQFGGAELLVVDLATGAVDRVTAGDTPTDLDLSPDGLAAVAVARGSAELWVYDAADPFAVPAVVPLPPEGQYGSLVFDPTGDQAVLYTTATAMERYAVWDRVTGELVERSLVKPVSGVAVTPTGESMLVFHPVTDGPSTDPLFAGEWALTLVDLEDFRSNPMKLPAEPLSYANSTTGERGYFVMEGSAFLEVLDYGTLLHEQYELASIPAFLGVLPHLPGVDELDAPAWVSQEHPLGRISFYYPGDESLETLTGFELNAGVE